jgi:phage protein D
MPDDMKPFVSRVTVKDEIDLFDEITLEIGGLEVTDRGQQNDLVNSKFFQIGNLLQIDMGYGNHLFTVGGGEIVKINPRFNRNGISIEVVAYDAFFRLQQTEHDELKPFSKERFSSVVRKVLANHSKVVGEVIIEIEKVNDIETDYPQKVGVNDYEFLKKHANANGFDFYNRFNPKTQKFDFYLMEPIEGEEPKFTYTYYQHNEDPLETLLDFDVEINVIDQVSDLAVISTDRKTKTKIQTYISVERPDGGQDVKFAGPDAGKAVRSAKAGQIRFKAFGQNFKVIRNKSFDDPKKNKAWAIMWLRENIENFITGSGTIIGNEAMQSRTVLDFQGIGEAYKGNWYLTSVEHTMTDGNVYLTKLNARKIAKGNV